MVCLCTVRHTTVYNSSRKRRPFIQTRSEEQHVQPRLRRVLLQSRGLTWLCLVVLRGHVREGHGGGAQAAQAQPNAQTHHTSRTSDHPVLHDVGRIVHAAPAHAHRHAERRANDIHHRVLHRDLRDFDVWHLHRQFDDALVRFRPGRAHLLRADGRLGCHDVRFTHRLGREPPSQGHAKAADGQRAGHHETRRDQGRAHRGHRHRVHHRRHHVRGAVPRPVQSQSWQCAAHAVGIVVLRGHGIQQRRLHP